MPSTKPILTKRFNEALAYASETHPYQVRQRSNVPHMVRRLGVVSIAIGAGADEDQAIAALPYDALEDQGGQTRLEDIRAHEASA